jgi:hypothetical protein
LSSSRPTDSPYGRTPSRVCSNAWFGIPSHLTFGRWDTSALNHKADVVDSRIDEAVGS